MLAELQSLAAIASALPDIRVTTGSSGCSWSFNWNTRVITANPADLALRPPDYCRGLILHEAAHGALTRLGDIIPRELHNGSLLHLLNVVEDCRIENWLQLRFPGCRPWVKLYNDRLLGLPEDRLAKARLASDPAGGFLAGLLSQWWKEEPPCDLHPLSLHAIDEVKPHFDLAVTAFPAPSPPDATRVRPLYQSHPVADCYRASDRWTSPTAEECVVRMTQHRMWCITWERLLPVFHRLLDHPDSEPTRHEIAAMNAAKDRIPKHLQQAEAAPVEHSGSPGIAVGWGGRGSYEPPEAATGMERDYAETVARNGALIEACATVVLQQLAAEAHPKITRFHRSGNLLDLRVAMQFEADPRQYDRLFRRRSLPTRPDPAFVVLVDASRSMDGERAKATFAGVVVLREVCLRLAIPLAVVGFGSRSRTIQTWISEDTPEVRGKIAALLNPTDGDTQLMPAFATAIELLRQCPRHDARLWILSDGDLDDRLDAEQAITRTLQGGTAVYGLGLGPESAGLSAILPGAEVGIQPEDLPAVFARMLTQQIFVRV